MFAIAFFLVELTKIPSMVRVTKNLCWSGMSRDPYWSDSLLNEEDCEENAGLMKKALGYSFALLFG